MINNVSALDLCLQRINSHYIKKRGKEEKLQSQILKVNHWKKKMKEGDQRALEGFILFASLPPPSPPLQLPMKFSKFIPALWLFWRSNFQEESFRKVTRKGALCPSKSRTLAAFLQQLETMHSASSLLHPVRPNVSLLLSCSPRCWCQYH